MWDAIGAPYPCRNLVCLSARALNAVANASVRFSLSSQCGVCPEPHTVMRSTRASPWRSFTPTAVADVDKSGELEEEEMEELCTELVLAAHKKEMGKLRKMESNGENVDRLKKSTNKLFDPTLEALKDPIRKTAFLSKVSLLATILAPQLRVEAHRDGDMSRPDISAARGSSPIEHERCADTFVWHRWSRQSPRHATQTTVAMWTRKSSLLRQRTWSKLRSPSLRTRS